MSHSIGLYVKIDGSQIQVENCFPEIKNRKQRDRFFSSISITSNLRHIYLKALKECTNQTDLGKFLNDKQAKDIVEQLEAMLEYIEDHRNKLKPLEPENGWGSYGGLCDSLISLIKACHKYPNAYIDDWY